MVPRVAAAATGLSGADQKDPHKAARLGGGPHSTGLPSLEMLPERNGSRCIRGGAAGIGMMITTTLMQRGHPVFRKNHPVEYYYGGDNEDPPGNEETETETATATATAGVGWWGGGWLERQRTRSS
eukprot:jgi/Psemu1/32809/gm1.32809_g